MEENITCKVSVLCATYNHEEYLRQTLDSFLNQKTDFPFEVLVNDDASTDSTGDIIREYAAKYPDVIRPFYQKENLYSRRINLYDVVFFPACRGEYIAVCEGDDYWNDPEKLQLQVNWLDTHPEYSACVHNSIGWIPIRSIPPACTTASDILRTSRTRSYLPRTETGISRLSRWFRACPMRIIPARSWPDASSS